MNVDADTPRLLAALRAGDLAATARVPKSDLHIHSIFGCRIEHIESWIGRPLRRPPARMASLDDMRDYGHEVLYPHILSREGFERTARWAVEDAIEDGVVRLEMSLDMRFQPLYEAVPDGYLSFVAALVESYRGRIDLRPEIGVSKNHLPADDIPRALACLRSGHFSSIDLYGNETAQPPEIYYALYAEARERGLKRKAHVGEFGGADLMGRALDVLGLDEIQHGIAAATSPRLMERLVRDGIRLNVCPSSNVALGAAPDMEHHPIRMLVDNGVRVTINSDDLTIFGRSVSQEYLRLYQCGLLTAEEIDGARREGLS